MVINGCNDILINQLCGLLTLISAIEAISVQWEIVLLQGKNSDPILFFILRDQFIQWSFEAMGFSMVRMEGIMEKFEFQTLLLPLIWQLFIKTIKATSFLTIWLFYLGYNVAVLVLLWLYASLFFRVLWLIASEYVVVFIQQTSAR